MSTQISGVLQSAGEALLINLFSYGLSALDNTKQSNRCFWGKDFKRQNDDRQNNFLSFCRPLFCLCSTTLSGLEFLKTLTSLINASQPFRRFFQFAPGLLFVSCVFFVSLGWAQERAIKAGDTIDILVFEHEALSRKVVVSENGTIDYPVLQGIPIDGISLSKLQEMISVQLSRYVGKRPVVVANFANSEYEVLVTVLGAVNQPGSYLVSSDASLQGAIAMAGGPSPGANFKNLKVRHTNNGLPEEKSFDLESILESGKVERMPRLQNGDVIFVTGALSTRTIKIIGSVRSPGEYQLYGDAGLLDLLAMTGGALENADLAHTSIVSPRQSSKQIFNLDMESVFYENGLSQLPKLQDGDIVFVPPKKGKNVWRSIIDFTRDLSVIGTLALLATRVL